MVDTKIVSYNVRGLCSACKGGRLWCVLCILGAEIVFLQETHFAVGSISRMPLFPFNQWFHVTSLIPRARGVTIAFIDHALSYPWK